MSPLARIGAAIIAAIGPKCAWCGARSDDPGAWWIRAAAGHEYGPWHDADPEEWAPGWTEHTRVTAVLCPRCAVIASREHIPHCGHPRQAMAEWEAASLLAAIDLGEAHLTPFRDPTLTFGTVDYAIHGGGFEGWRLAVFKDGYGVAWDYVETVQAPDGRAFDPFRLGPSTPWDHVYLACDDCAAIVKNWSPADRVLRGAYGMRGDGTTKAPAPAK